jgi:hypothetical protein
MVHLLNLHRFLFGFIGILIFSACNHTPKESSTTNLLEKKDALFTLLSSKQTGINFSNDLKEDITTNWNIMSFDYFYHGAGVAIGDINNDNLPDVFMSGNMSPNKLYLNKGNMKFEDISEKARINQGKKWSAGVTMADVNGDGFQDIYVSQAGPYDNETDRENLLYINNGDLTFSEKGKDFGLNDGNRSTSAAFFDYDKDGDLDCFVLNESKYFRVVLAEVFKDIKNPKSLDAASCHLYQNNNGKFTKVTKEAGMLRYGYGLGLAVSDLNNDGWMDVYVANDYSVPDFMYINQGNGTFKDEIKIRTKQISYFGMGCDIADINNDGLVDVMVLDMAADDHIRGKTLMASMDIKGFRYYVNDLKYQYQYMFNSLQLNNGNGTFSNIANLSGTASTDWSWAALLADFDNDGYKDYFVSNGYRRYTRDNDFRRMLAKKKEEYGGNIPMGKRAEIFKLLPEIKLPNVLYKNNGDLTFSKKNDDWGMNEATFSNGAAYADLDNDGDLDLVVNNIDEPAFVYKNNAIEQSRGNYLRVKLKGETISTPITGAKVTIHYNGEIQLQELMNTRGFESAVEEVLHFGLGDVSNIDNVEVKWPNGKTSLIENVPVNQVLVINQSESDKKMVNVKPDSDKVFQKKNPSDFGISFKHTENQFDDFVSEILLPHKQSTLGPKISAADANGDGLEDFFIGGAAGQSGVLYFQKTDGTFRIAQSTHFGLDQVSEDLDALFFDGNNDGNIDMYVVSGGGGEFKYDTNPLQDRLYANVGQGKFIKTKGALPEMLQSGNVAKGADFDQDGDTDIFVGGAGVPGKYPYAAKSYLLRNDFGSGKINDVTEQLAPELSEIGMVKDAVWTDLNGDKFPDLIVVGEWMSIKVFLNENGKLRDASAEFGTADLKGWWYSIAAADIDNDGDQDFIVGNIGLNSKFHASKKKPFRVFADDFDGNGSCDIVLSKEYKGKMVPTRGRQCSSEQMPFIKEKFPTYKEFATAGLEDILGDKAIENSLNLEVNTFESIILINEGNSFTIKYLPNEAQIAPINAIIPHDIDSDGNIDLILAGNNYDTEVETPRYDAGNGLVLKGLGNGAFKVLGISESGFFVPGNVKDLAFIKRTNGNHLILVAQNNAPLEVFEIRKDGLLSLK